MATRVSAGAFIAGLSDERRKRESETLLKMMREISGESPVMWGSSIIGFGTYHYKYASGREGDWMKIGIANNKRYISLYCCAADARGHVAERYRKRLPKASIGKSCVRFKRLDDLDEEALRALIRETAKTSFSA